MMRHLYSVPIDSYKTYLHAPAHLFRRGATYFITAAIYQKKHLIASPARKAFFFTPLAQLLGHHGWKLIAWVVLHNHYHLLSVAPEAGATSLARWIANLHRRTATRWNSEDKCATRKVWWNYWDTCITRERSYYARLNYIHFNPVKHGLVLRPEEYPFSSYLEYLRAQPEVIARIMAEYPLDRVDIFDDF